MTDFLRALVGRTLGVDDAVRPRLASTFEPGAIAPSPAELLEVEAATEALPPAPTVRRSAAAVRQEATPPPPETPPVELPPRPSSAAGPITRRQRVEEGAATAAAPAAPRSASLTAVPVAGAPERRSAEPSARPAAADPSPSPREPARAPVRATGSARSPRAAPPSEAPATPQAAAPAAPHARVVETHVVERGGGDPRQTAQLPVRAGWRPRASAEETAAGALSRESAEPIVHVHIGRIEVRAPAAPERRRAPRPREPRLSLDDYLAQTRQGRR